MEPNSVALVVLLFFGAGGGIAMAVLLRPVAVKVAGGLLALVLAGTAGVAVVNDYYGYYQSWSQLSADLSGSYAAFTNTRTSARDPRALQPGQVRAVTFPGRRSGITRTGLVYLPPQYFQKRFAHTRFPVVELFHGTPGEPTDWVVHLRVAEIMDRLLRDHEIGPMILVMPASNAGRHFEECLNAPGALDDTYVSTDVPADVRARFRASRLGAEWGALGYSSGGYCAANLALRHRAAYGAAAIMDGYFRPGDGEAAAALHNDPVAEAANNPLLAASNLSWNTSPLPAFWLAAGTGDAADAAAARAFAAALHGIEQVTVYDEPRVGHNLYAWEAALPRALAWMWGRLAPPSLQVQFPLAGSVRHSVFGVPSGVPATQRREQRLALGSCTARSTFHTCAFHSVPRASTTQSGHKVAAGRQPLGSSAVRRVTR